jgi:gamma-glutamyltranspeptidase/glutathione hydrolase
MKSAERSMTRIVVLLAAALVVACAQAPAPHPAAVVPIAPAQAPPEPQIAATAHPLATRAAVTMLARGGSPIDAAIAAQMVLGLVEPESSGVGGGTLILYWDAREKKLSGFDGLAAAPARVTASLRTDVDGTLLESEPSQHGGRTVGVPGTVPVLYLAHRKFGKLPWADLFEPAIELAERGFPLSRFMHDGLGVVKQSERFGLTRDWYDANGAPRPVGTTLFNREYAKTMRRIAAQGPAGLYSDGGDERIVAAAQAGFRPTLMTPADLREYRPKERTPLCGPFISYRVCVAAPPSYGGIAVLQILQMLEARSGGHYDFSDPAFVHLYAEAGKLAQADRRRYVGDPDFVEVPSRAMVDRRYVTLRAASIDAARANPSPAPGLIAARREMAESAGGDASMTSQIAIADRDGNAVSITTTINLFFGSWLMADGFVLNDVLTNFSAAPKAGETIANQMAARKRPVTSMAPTIVFDANNVPVVVGGSAGGGPIIDYVAQSLIEMLANGRTPIEALAAGHVTTAVPARVRLESERFAAGMAQQLRARGHEVEEVPLRSGLAFIRRVDGGWIGAADPRRDGSAEGR